MPVPSPSFSPISMSTHWFAPWGLFYRPASAMGVLVTVLALAFCVQVFWAVDRGAHSVTDTLYGVYPFIVPTLLLWERIAAKTSIRGPQRAPAP